MESYKVLTSRDKVVKTEEALLREQGLEKEERVNKRSRSCKIWEKKMLLMKIAKQEERLIQSIF